MKFKSALMTEASGSLGGMTASHNRGGKYLRERVIPVNPNTPQQQVVKGFLTQLASLWLNTLDAAQREAWDIYALNVLLTDRLGEPRNVGGLAMYIRSNVPRLQAASTRIDAAPTTFNLGDFTPPTIASITAPTALSLAFTDTDDWVGEDDAHMIVLGSRGTNASINFFKGPYRFAATIDGDSSTPPTSPEAIVMPFTLAAGQNAFIQVRVTRADGRLSTPFRIGSVVV